MTIELGITLTLVAGIIGVATFLIGRQTAAHSSGREWGELKTDIAYIKSDVKEIKFAMAEISRDSMAAINRETENRRASIERLHKRIDQHERDYHGAAITPRDSTDAAQG